MVHPILDDVSFSLGEGGTSRFLHLVYILRPNYS